MTIHDRSMVAASHGSMRTMNAERLKKKEDKKKQEERATATTSISFFFFFIIAVLRELFLYGESTTHIHITGNICE